MIEQDLKKEWGWGGGGGGEATKILLGIYQLPGAHGASTQTHAQEI